MQESEDTELQEAREQRSEARLHCSAVQAQSSVSMKQRWEVTSQNCAVKVQYSAVKKLRQVQELPCWWQASQGLCWGVAETEVGELVRWCREDRMQWEPWQHPWWGPLQHWAANSQWSLACHLTGNYPMQTSPAVNRKRQKLHYIAEEILVVQ